MLEQKYIDVLEKMDWRVVAYSDDGSEVEIESFSPAGEDIVFSVSTKDFPRAVKEYACDFDPDEHVEMWVEAKINGRQGIPSIRELVFDADNIENMLSSLAMELRKVENYAEAQD